MLQSNLYNENNRYLKWVMKNKKELLGFDLKMLVNPLYTLLGPFLQAVYGIAVALV